MKKLFLVVASVMVGNILTSAQANTATMPAAPLKNSVYLDPVFYTLAAVAIILLIFIGQMARVLSVVAKNYRKGDNSVWDKMRSLLLIVGLLVFSTNDSFGQAAAASAAPAPKGASGILNFLHDGFGSNAMNAVVVIILIEIFVLLYLVRMTRLFLEKQKELAPLKERKVTTSVFWDKFNSSIAVEAESAVLTDHDYDGIRELDNALPPWWKYGFYFTIVWAFIYLAYYHVSGGPSSDKEYVTQMSIAAEQDAAYRARSKNLVDETNVVLLTQQSDLSAGNGIYTQYCAVCHGPDGGGVVGPNFTDEYWLHGGDIKDLFNTIKYGVQGKGMKSWQQELSPVMMAQVASFILGFQGTKPANPKAPEGQVWKPTAATTDSLANFAADSLNKLSVDSTKMKNMGVK